MQLRQHDRQYMDWFSSQLSHLEQAFWSHCASTSYTIHRLIFRALLSDLPDNLPIALKIFLPQRDLIVTARHSEDVS